jgi:hypothetical protein
MTRKAAVVLPLLVLLAAMSLLAQTPTQFSADLKYASRGIEGGGKLYFGGSKVRMDMGAMGSMITDPGRKVSYMLMPGSKTYMEISTAARGGRTSGPDWRMYNAANPCADSPEMSCQKTGTGMVNGRLCNKWSFTSKRGAPNMTVWIDQKSGIPIKSEMTDGTKLELYNIKEGRQSQSLFEVPSGYKKMDMGSMMR